MIDHIKMLLANDVYQLYLKNIPLQKAIRQVQYLMQPTEIIQAKHELIRLGKQHDKQADDYRRAGIDKRLHDNKQVYHLKANLN